MPDAVVLLSGGLDSYTAAAIARADGYRLFALTLRYGQRHACEIDAARAVAVTLGVERHIEFDVDLSVFGGSSLTTDAPVPKDRRIDPAWISSGIPSQIPSEIPSTYVPARNTVFLSLALAWAETLCARDIFIGVNALDYSGYPDCRPEFIAAFEHLASLATAQGVGGARFRVHAPLQHLTKADIIRKGLELGLDYGLTHSCYDPGPEGRPCGRCDSCVLRAGGFAQAGIDDPLLRRQASTPLLRFPPLPTSDEVTNRIYYTDPSCRTFDASVRRAFEHEGRPAVILDRTAFYPSSGGQAFDTGRLGAAAVVETVDAEDAVIHVLSAALAAGVAVTGEIDWARRFDHMQQHTGQHVLSAAFDRLFDNRTVGFHMGADESTIDLVREAAPLDVERAVDEANRIVWEDRPVSIRFVSQAKAANLPLRKESAREGTLRLIDISDFDLSACGGTHVERTGAIGVVAVLSAERLRGGSRLTFACGGRALRALRTYRDAVAGGVRALSVLPADLPAAVLRVQAESKDLRNQIKGLQEKLAAYEGTRLVADAPQVGGVRLLVQALDGWDVAGLKAVAVAATSAARACVVLISPVPPVSLVVARSAGVPVDANAVLQQLTSRFGGRGGGKPELAQGGGLTAPVQEIVSAARALIESTLG